MIGSVKDQASEDVFNGLNTRRARNACPRQLWRLAYRKLDQLDSVVRLEELEVPPGNRLERLSGDRKDQYSFRINQQYRICFRWGDNGPFEVEITDYH